MYRFIAAIVFLLSLTPAVSAQVKIVVTTPELGLITQAIAGSDATVKTLIGNQNPHYADGRPSFVVDLRKADLFIRNGMSLEDAWLTPLLSAARNNRINPGALGHLDASQRVKKREVGMTDRALGDIHPEGNPHYLLDPREVLTVAADIGQRLAKIDPGNAAKYLNRTRAFRKDVFLFAKGQRARFTKLSGAKRAVVTYHKSMTYFANWLGLRIVGEIEPKPGISPTPSHVSSVLKRMKASDVKAILQLIWYPRTTTEKLAKLTGAQAVYVGPASYKSYIGFLRTITDKLYAILSK